MYQNLILKINLEMNIKIQKLENIFYSSFFMSCVLLISSYLCIKAFHRKYY